MAATPTIEVLEADITQLAVDAITNAANTRLLHGGGVAGAIRRAGGPAIDEESRARAPIGLGEAIETGGGDMPCRYVIHAATMVNPAGTTTAEVIRACTAATLAGLRRIVFAVHGAAARAAFEAALHAGR